MKTLKAPLRSRSERGSAIIHVFLSHDVDWGRDGPSASHVLARKERFDEDLLEESGPKDLYYNLPGYMDIEEKFSVRSTFFSEPMSKTRFILPLPIMLKSIRLKLDRFSEGVGKSVCT